MPSLHSIQLSKASQLVSEEEQSYESTILTSPLPCESSINMDELLDDGEIWLEELAGESPTKRSHSLVANDTLVLPPRRRLSFGSRRKFGDENDSRKFQSKQFIIGGGATTTRRAYSMDHTLLSQSTGALQCDPASVIPHSTCFLRTRALSAGAIDIVSWKLADRCRRRSKGTCSLQEASTSVRALPREAELEELDELNKSNVNDSSNKHMISNNVSKSRSRSPGTRQGARRSARRGSIYGTLEERLSKSTGAIDFSCTPSSPLVPHRTCLVRPRRVVSFGDSRPCSKGGGSDRRRMLKQGKQMLLKSVSTSIRALPREAEIETANFDDDRLEDSFQAIFDTISDLDTRVRSVMKEFEIGPSRKERSEVQHHTF